MFRFFSSLPYKKTFVFLVFLVTVMAFKNKMPGNTLLVKKSELKGMDPDPVDSFPVPTGNPKQLFYLQRTSNINTIVCELNLDNKGQLNEENPVHVFWIRYAEGGMKKELNYIQRVFAYGIITKSEGNGVFDMHFVSYKKLHFKLMRSPKDNKYLVYANINKKQAVLNRFFIKIDGGSFWSPNIIYMEMKGNDPITGKEMIERFKP
jgi:Domain of unknown function (DUF4833)